MKIEIDKTYSIWEIISRLAGITALVAMIYYSYNSNYDKATFYAVIYLIIIVGIMKDKMTCDCEEDDEDASN